MKFDGTNGRLKTHAWLLSCLVGFVALHNAFFSHALAADSQLFPCTVKGVPQTGAAQCEVDVFEGQLVSRVGVSTIPDNQPVSARYIFNGPEGSPTTVGILWGASPALSTGDFNRLKSVIAATLNPNPAFISYGLWTFATDIKSIAPFGTSPATIKLAMEGIRPAGKTFELLRSINDISNNVISSSTRRKVLIVLSDGLFDDTAYTIPELSNKLRAAGVRVFVVIPSRVPEAITAAQSLRRLADETGGYFLTAYNQDSAQKVAQTIKAFVEDSGYVAFESAGKSVRVDVLLTNNKTLSQVVEAPAASAEPIEKAAPTQRQEKPWPSPIDYLTVVADWLAATPLRYVLVTGGGLIGVLAIAGGWFWRRRKNTNGRQQATDKLDDGDATISDMRPILGWLEFFDANESKEPIRAKVTRIGRQTDNDVVIHNSTVHRHHAVLKQELDGAFVIMDMNMNRDESNGVLVNGDPVTTGPVRDGDTIELGEIRMRFRKS